MQKEKKKEEEEKMFLSGDTGGGGSLWPAGQTGRYWGVHLQPVLLQKPKQIGHS